MHFANFRCEDFQKATTAPIVFIQFQLNFMESMVIKGEYRVLLWGRSIKFKEKRYGVLKFLLTQGHIVLEILKC